MSVNGEQVDPTTSTLQDPAPTGGMTDNFTAPVKANLRVSSLVLAAFPWTTSIVMSPTGLSENLTEDHYAYVRIFNLELFKRKKLLMSYYIRH